METAVEALHADHAVRAVHLPGLCASLGYNLSEGEKNEAVKRLAVRGDGMKSWKIRM